VWDLRVRRLTLNPSTALIRVLFAAITLDNAQVAQLGETDKEKVTQSHFFLMSARPWKVGPELKRNDKCCARDGV